jgi:glutamyl-tRNA(Gln) amidotransferase subunit D
MLEAGALEGGDMLPEVALVKLMWSIANTETVKDAESLLKTPIAGELSVATSVTV